MPHLLRPCLLLVCLGLLPSAAQGARAGGFDSKSAAKDQPRVFWNGKALPQERWQSELNAGARQALGSWQTWAQRLGSRFELSLDQRVLLVVSDERASSSAERKLLEQTLALFDQRAPLPVGRAAAEPAQPQAPDAQPGMPEQPGSPEHPDGSWSWSWSDQPELESQTAVLFQLRNEADQALLLEELVAQHSWLAPWAETAKALTGFVLERPLLGAWLASAAGQQEWSPEHELVNRAAQLLLLRRFGRLPYWLEVGFAWRIEEELLGGLYCFPYRSDFVFAVEHTAWSKTLALDFEGRDKRPLELAELELLQRGRFEARSARAAYGLCGFLLQHHAPAFPELCESLRLYREQHERITHADGSWELDTGYELPPEVIAQALETLSGPQALAQATRFFQQGKSYKAPKAP